MRMSCSFECVHHSACRRRNQLSTINSSGINRRHGGDSQSRIGVRGLPRDVIDMVAAVYIRSPWSRKIEAWCNLLNWRFRWSGSFSNLVVYKSPSGDGDFTVLSRKKRGSIEYVETCERASRYVSVGESFRQEVWLGERSERSTFLGGRRRLFVVRVFDGKDSCYVVSC